MKPLSSLLPVATLVASTAPLLATQVPADTLDEVRAALAVPDADWTWLDLPTSATRAFRVPVEVEGQVLSLELHPHSLRAPNFQLYVQREDGLLRAEAPPAPATLRGEVAGWPGAIVAASLTDEGLEGSIVLPNGDSIGIQPFRSVVPSADRGLHVVYGNRDIQLPPAECGTPDGPDHSDLETVGGGSFYASTKRRQEIAFDSDVQFFNDNGGSVNASVADIEAIQNGVDVIYDRDVDVQSVITTIIVRTSEPDPYTTSAPQGLLNEFRDHWNAEMRHITRDVAHLMTGRNLNGSTIGIALPSVVCNVGSAYALSESTFTGNYTSRVGLTSHEIGHNYSSGHCNGTSPCYIMCSGLGGCSGSVAQFSPSVKTIIGTYATNRPCLIEITPPLAMPFEARFPDQQLVDEHWTFRTMEDADDDALRVPSAPWAGLLDGKGSTTIVGDELWSNEMLLAGESGLLFSFFVQHVGVEAGESLVVEYLDASDNWNVLTTVVSDAVSHDYFRFHELPLPAAAYHDGFRLRFRALVDELDDDWYIDDIRIQTDPICTGPEPYGTGKINSIGLEPTVRWFGQNTLTSNDLAVFLSNAVPGQFALPFWGSAPAATPFLGGTLWVANPVQRGPLSVLDTFGYAEYAVPIDASMVGTTEYYQWFFRDPAHPDGTGFGLSDGLRVPYCP